MSDLKHLSIDQDARGVVTVTFDHASKPVNVFDEELMRELRSVVTNLAANATAKLVVFRSGKASGFFAGADVSAIQAVATPQEAVELLRAGQELFGRVEELKVPTVAVIHGNCLGGGLELALACTFRIARDDGDTRLGLPETQLGLIPAWGGSQRLPRTVGASTAIRMILEATRIAPRKAKSIGLVDEIAVAERFDEVVEEFIRAKLNDACTRRRTSSWRAWVVDHTPLGRWLYIRAARWKTAEAGKNYPALAAALNAIEVGLSKGMTAGLAQERTEFSKLLFTSTARNLLELFFRRERARQVRTWIGPERSATRDVQTIAVLGGGTMGAGIAQLAASKGYRVIVKELNDELAQAGLKRIDVMFARAVQKHVMTAGELEQARSRISATAKLEDMKSADLVIEAIVERLDIKQQVFRELDHVLPERAMLVSNTSALSISQLAGATRRASQVAGLHFFNPVQKMPLVEIVRCESTSEEVIATLLQLVKRFGKTPLVVAEGPGFLVNRVLFPYLEEAMRLVLEGIPTADIDRAAKRFGMPMGPLELLDTVGLDVALDVAKTLGGEQVASNPTYTLLTKMVEHGLKGQKSGAGFYRYSSGKRTQPHRVFPDEPRSQSSVPPDAHFNGEVLNGITQRLVFSMINSAAGALQAKIVPEAWMVDLGMVLGTGFAPFRGGPMQLINDWGRVTVVRTLEQLAEMCGSRFQPSTWFLQESGMVPEEEHIVS